MLFLCSEGCFDTHQVLEWLLQAGHRLHPFEQNVMFEDFGVEVLLHQYWTRVNFDLVSVDSQQLRLRVQVTTTPREEFQ